MKMTKYRVTQLLHCPFQDGVETAAAKRGKRAHAVFESRFQSPPWRIEEEVCIDVAPNIKVCGHPDLYIVTGSHGYVLEYKSVNKLRYEYVMQVAAYKALLGRKYGKPFYGGLLLKDRLLTDANWIPREIGPVVNEVVYVEWEDPDWVWEQLVAAATNPSPKVGPWCSYCSLREKCSEYNEYRVARLRLTNSKIEEYV